jgi:hypothetical protein
VGKILKMEKIKVFVLFSIIFASVILVEQYQQVLPLKKIRAEQFPGICT